MAANYWHVLINNNLWITPFDQLRDNVQECWLCLGRHGTLFAGLEFRSSKHV